MGQIPIYETRSLNYYLTAIQKGKIKFTTDTAMAKIKLEIIFLALPTPLQDGSMDLSYILGVASNCHIITEYKII